MKEQTLQDFIGNGEEENRRENLLRKKRDLSEKRSDEILDTPT